MEQRESVKVYSYRVFDMQANRMSLSSYKATREAIVLRLGGEVLEGTEHEVARAEVDEQGRYRRIATGWGELT